MASSDRQFVMLKLKFAKDAFDEYLQDAARPEHYLSVDQAIGPLRRMDGDSISLIRQKFIGSRFTWNDTTGRWETVEGSLILAEDKIWNLLCRILCQTDERSERKLYDNLKEKVEGLLLVDLRTALTIWRDHALDVLGSNLEAAIEAFIWGVDVEDVAPPEEGLILEESSPSPSPESNTSVGESVSPQTHPLPSNQVINTFHPRYPDLLSVGTSGLNGKVVYFAWRPRRGGRKSVSHFYTDDLTHKSQDELRIIWHPHLQIDPIEVTQGLRAFSRRDLCRRIIEENVSTAVQLDEGRAPGEVRGG